MVLRCDCSRRHCLRCHSLRLVCATIVLQAKARSSGISTGTSRGDVHACAMTACTPGGRPFGMRRSR
eukprot:6420002-Heterocapsa_arctica.AAC.1